MVAATYELKVDTLRDGSYGASIDDITSRVLSLQWNEGMQDSYQQFAPPARLTVNLNNIDGAFNADTLGTNLVTNQEFSDWTSDDPDGWTVTGEVGADPEISEVGEGYLHGNTATGSCNFYSTSDAVSISQDILTIGTSYRAYFEISASSEATGYLALYSGSDLISPRYHLGGTYTIYFTATSATFKIEATGAVDMTMKYVYVQEVADYGYLLSKGTLGRLRVTYNGTTYTKFVGRLSNKNVLPGSIGRRIAVLEFIDPMYELLDTEYQPPLQTSTTVDAAIAKIFDEAIAPFPYSRSYWMLGVQGAGELGLTTYIYSPPAYDFETGVTTLDYIGDNQHQDGAGINAQAFVRSMVEAEIDGRFWYDASSGQYIFHNRHHDTLNTASDGGITAAMFESDMSSFLDSDLIINYASLDFQPRKVGSAGSVIWQADNLPIGLSPQSEYKTVARYRDATLKNTRIGAIDCIQPIAGTDYVLSDPSAYNDVSLQVIFNANSADIKIVNNSLSGLNITSFQLRGTPLQTFDSRAVTSRNPDSEYVTKYMPETYSIKALSDEDFAQQVVDYRVRKFSTPITRFASVGFIANNSHQRMINALSFVIENRINVEDAWLGHDQDYIIVGIRHMVKMGGEHHHETTFVLKPQSREIFWTLGVTGYSELNLTTRLAL